VGDGAYLEDCIVGHGYDARPGGRIKGGTLIRWPAARIFSTDLL
jgi:mannose-1-phosphate guanylyltransferase